MASGRISFLLLADLAAVYALYVLMTYLTDVWGLSLTHAAAIVNIWIGASRILIPVVAFLADTILGKYYVVVISTISYCIGLVLLFMSTPPVVSKVTGTCSEEQPECIGKTQQGLFYASLALLTIGNAGHAASLESFLGDQMTSSADYDEHREAKAACAECLVSLFTVICTFAVPLIKPQAIQFAIPAIITVIATVVFLTGSSSYKKNEPEGSPLTTAFRVIVAAASKITHPLPENPELRLHWGYGSKRNTAVKRTEDLRCLDKAAILLPSHLTQEDEYRWRFCTVKEVEDTKIAIRLIPQWIPCIMCGLVSSFGNTYFQEQANNMNRKIIGEWEISLQVLLLLHEGILKKWISSLIQKMECGAVPRMGMAMSLVFSVLCCIAAAKVETRRLGVVTAHGYQPDETIPMSVFWLLPQFVLLAAVDLFLEECLARFFIKHGPMSMRGYTLHFGRAVSGLGFIANVLSVYLVGRVSEMGGKQSWFQYSLDQSRLDNYYWTLAAFTAVAFVVYVPIAITCCCKGPLSEVELEIDRQNRDYFPIHGHDDSDDDVDHETRCCCCCCC